MIQLQFENLDTIWHELDNKVSGIGELTSSTTKNQIAKAVFTITSRKFLSDFSIEAARFPQKYHHMFEWEQVGNKSKKLFKIKRGTLNQGNMNISFNFQKSTSFVPIPSKLKSMGKTGKSVKRRSVFANKAEVMEAGRPVGFTTKRYIAFLSGNTGEIQFLSPRKLVSIMNPGGKQVAGSFDRYVTRWYSTKVDSTIATSGLLENIGKSVAKSLQNTGTGKNQAKEAIRIITEKYAQGVTEL
jgi:hypothetical protein